MKKLGNILIAVLILLAIAIVAIVCILFAEAITKILEPITWTSHIFIALGIIFVILSLMKDLKRSMLPPILIISYILGFFLFLCSSFIIFHFPPQPYNYILLIVGVLLCGFGVTPIALITCIYYHSWPYIGHILVMMVAASLFRWYFIRQTVALGSPSAPKEADASVQ